MGMTNKKTLVLGASPNPARYGYLATNMLMEYKHDVVPFGIKKGDINGVRIVNELPDDTDFDTVTLYLNPANQKEYYDYIIGLKPNRVVFNPGTENEELAQKLLQNGIQPLEACTLVLLRTGQY
jgi:predicted CoA-binding protein